MFITIEGIDGTGKTTLIKGVENYLISKGIKVHITKEPTENDIGKLIRNRLKVKDDKNIYESTVIDALLFAADRVDHQYEISKYVDDGYIVISDRYNESSIAYQHANGVPLNWIESINLNAIEADHIILLDMLPSNSLQRRYKDTKPEELEKFEDEEYLSRVRQNFLQMAAIRSTGCSVIDASKSPQEVLDQAIKIIDALIK